MLEARELNHAITLMSKHPGLRVEPCEIRTTDEEVRRFLKNVEIKTIEDKKTCSSIESGKRLESACADC